MKSAEDAERLADPNSTSRRSWPQTRSFPPKAARPVGLWVTVITDGKTALLPANSRHETTQRINLTIWTSHRTQKPGQWQGLHIFLQPSHRDRAPRKETRQLGSAAAHGHRRGNGLAALAAAALWELACGNAGKALVRFHLFSANAANSSELVLFVSEPILYNDLKACNDRARAPQTPVAHLC